MNIVFEIAPEKKSEAELMAKGDDIISRQSITIRSADSLGISGKTGNVYILIIDGSEIAIKRAREILKDMAKESDHADEIMEIVKADEDRAAEGFGSIFG